MAIRILSKEKTKKKSKVKDKVTPSTVGEGLTEELGKLSDKIKPLEEKLKPLKKSYTSIESELLKEVDANNTPKQSATFVGENYVSSIGAKGNKTEIIDIKQTKAYLESVEEGLFMTLATISITELRKYLTPDQFDEVTKTSRVNKRKVTISKKD